MPCGCKKAALPEPSPETKKQQDERVERIQALREQRRNAWRQRPGRE